MARGELEKQFATPTKREEQFLTRDKLKSELDEVLGKDQVILKPLLEERLKAFLSELRNSSIAADVKTMLGNGTYSGELVFPRTDPGEVVDRALWVKRADGIDFEGAELRITSSNIDALNLRLWSAATPKEGSVSIKYLGGGGDLARCVLEFTIKSKSVDAKNSSGGHYVIAMLLHGRSENDWRVIRLQLEPKPATPARPG
jgi:hypothetical protein